MQDTENPIVKDFSELWNMASVIDKYQNKTDIQNALDRIKELRAKVK